MPLELFGNVNLLQKGLEAAQTRQDTIANNIANIDTPNFKASHVEFESYMKKALEDGDADAMGIQPQVVQDNSTSMRMDGNNVDIDEQMTEMAKNTVWYSTLAQKLGGELERLRIAINGR